MREVFFKLTTAEKLNQTYSEVIKNPFHGNMAFAIYCLLKNVYNMKEIINCIFINYTVKQFIKHLKLTFITVGTKLAKNKIWDQFSNNRTAESNFINFDSVIPFQILLFKIGLPFTIRFLIIWCQLLYMKKCLICTFVIIPAKPRVQTI